MGGETEFPGSKSRHQDFHLVITIFSLSAPLSLSVVTFLVPRGTGESVRIL